MDDADPKGLLAELSKLEQLRRRSAGVRRRRHPRFIVRGDAQLLAMDRPSSNEPPLTVMLRDLGRGGLGFVADRTLDAGATRRIRVMQRGYGIGELSIIVRHCRRVKDQVYLVGCQICVDNGLMYLLGVDPTAIQEGDNPATAAASAAFLPPGEVE